MDRDNFISFRIPAPTDHIDVLSHFYYLENNSSVIVQKTLLPSFRAILIFNFGAKSILYFNQDKEITVDKCLVLGPIKQAFDYSLPPSSQMLVANFKNDALYRFFGSASVAQHSPIHPDELLEESCFSGLWTKLDKMNDTAQRVNYILEFGRHYLGDRNVIAEKLANFNDQNLNPIKYIANQHNQTVRNIQLYQKKYLGFTYKEISRYQRFFKSIELIQIIAATGTKIDWFEIINKGGYFDQSQLIRDFKHYIGISPTKYLKFREDICIAKAK